MDNKNLNVPINAKVLDEFKKNCTRYGLTMKITVEALMKYFNSCNDVQFIINQSGAEILRLDKPSQKADEA